MAPRGAIERQCFLSAASVAGALRARRWPPRRPLSPLGDLAQHLVEVGGLAEVAVDRGEAHVGDGIEALQRLHDELADHGGRHLLLAHALELAHDARHHALDALGLDRPLAQRDLDERESFSRSNGTRRPERLMTMISRSCTRSKVVKRPPQSSQMRRRRIDWFSSVGRLSLTWVFSQLQ